MGDGTTTVAVLAGELLKKAEVLLDQKIHATVIVQGYRMAAEKAIEIVKSISFDASMKDRDLLEKVAKTAMTGKLVESPDSKMAKFAVDLVLNAVETYNGKKSFDMDRVNVEKKGRREHSGLGDNRGRSYRQGDCSSEYATKDREC